MRISKRSSSGPAIAILTTLATPQVVSYWLIVVGLQQVRPGAVVHAGQLIGYEGRTGHASGCHVHFGLFNPHETKTFGVRADLLHDLRLPPLEIARIDPLLVLPGGGDALRTRQIPSSRATAPSWSEAKPTN